MHAKHSSQHTIKSSTYVRPLQESSGGGGGPGPPIGDVRTHGGPGGPLEFEFELEPRLLFGLFIVAAPTPLSSSTHSARRRICPKRRVVNTARADGHPRRALSENVYKI